MSFEATDAGGLPTGIGEKFKNLAVENVPISERENNNTLPTLDDELAGGRKCGDCLIFDYQKFLKTSSEEDESRPGSEHDVARLKHDFTALNFNVYSDYLNKTKDQTLEILREAAKRDHSQSKYFVCCFLTHGDEGKLSMHDTDIEIVEILQCFSRSACETLSGKPKIFIIEACRGNCCEEGVPIDSTNLSPNKAPTVSTNLAPVKKPNDLTHFAPVVDNPDYLDFLIAYSTCKGKFSFKTKDRKPGGPANHGSYFIDELCRTLEQFSDKLDLLQILTITNYRVAYLFETKFTKKPEYRFKKQMPSFTSRLRSEVKFNKKIKMFKSRHTQYFDERRKETELGMLSTDDPLKDNKTYSISSTERIMILFLCNMRDNFQKDLSACADKLWSSAGNRDYRKEESKDWSKDELMNFLKEFRSRDFSNFDCFICFIACKAKGDSLYDDAGHKLLIRRIVEQFTGEKCSGLLQKPKIFIYLLTSPPKKLPWLYRWLCVSAESTDGEGQIMIPEHADILEVAITIKDSNQLNRVTDKFCNIFGGESSENFLSQMTRMNEELATEFGYHSDLSDEPAPFCLNSTLTKMLILNNPNS